MGCVPRHLLAQEQQSWAVWEPPLPKTLPKPRRMRERQRQGPALPREGACTPMVYRLHQGSVTVLPKNTCSLVNPGSAYLKGHIRQLAYLL